MTTRILFVCLGNICRSPAAEGVFRSLAPEYEIDSAGTGSWHVGEAPYPAMQAAARARGHDLSHQRARQFRIGDFTEFDMILAMDPDNRATIEAMRPAGDATPVRLFMDYAAAGGTDRVPDPYYTGDFEEALDLIEQAACGLRVALAADRR